MFAVIGEALLDMVQHEPGSAFVARPGGSPLNVAVGLHRLGHPTELVARLSSGNLGAMVRRHAEDNGLGLGATVATDDSTTLAFASLDKGGHASYDFYVNGTADWGWKPADLAALPPGVRVVHTGSLTAAMSPGAEVVLALWQQLAAEGRLLLSFDPNIRPALMVPRAAAVARIEQFVAASHVVKASDEDLHWLYPDMKLDDVLQTWASMGPELVVMTRGADGCIGVRRTAKGTGPIEQLELDGVSVAVLDTIGAGDAFESGLLSALADADAAYPGCVETLSAADLESVLACAVTVSAMTCQRAGADPPTRAAYDAWR